MLLSVGWDNRRGGSTVARHEWKDLSKFPYKLEDWVEKEKDEKTDRERRAQRRTQRMERIPGSFTDESDHDE